MFDNETLHFEEDFETYESLLLEFNFIDAWRKRINIEKKIII